MRYFASRPSRRALGAGLLTLAVAMGSTFLARHGVDAADHADSPDTSEGNLDINDLYVFNRGSDVVFALTVSPLLAPGSASDNAFFNPEGLYQIKLDRERDGIADAVIQIVPVGTGSAQTIDVRGPVAPQTTGPGANGIVAGPSVRGGLEETFSGQGMTVYAGVRDDPFFIDLFGDMSVTSVLNAVYSSALGTTVGEPGEQTLAFNPEATDDLAGLNTLAVVIEMPKAQVASALGITEMDSFFAWATSSARN